MQMMVAEEKRKKSEPDFTIEWGRRGAMVCWEERKINMQIYSFNQNLNML